MQLLTPELLDRYLGDDTVLALLQQLQHGGDEAFASHRWLRESPPKRLLFQRLYGDLLAGGTRRLRVLDVGGGFTALTRRILAHHDYELVDIMAHGGHDALRALEKEVGREFWHPVDWYDLVPDAGGYDVVVANDLLPNVDQRLELFLAKFVPVADEVRLSLTFYETPRFYPARRVDGDEVLFVLAWDGERTSAALAPYRDRIDDADFGAFAPRSPSVFPNERQVCTVTVRGARSEAAAGQVRR